MITSTTQFVTPPGRIVMGDCFKGYTTDSEGNPLLHKKGPNIGQPRVNFYLGLAVAKTDPGWSGFHSLVQNQARTSFSNLFDSQGVCLNPDFAFKIIDGDDQKPNTKGKKPCDHDNFPGHWIVNLSNGFAPSCYTSDNGVYQQVTDPNTIKCGYYVQVAGVIKGNDSDRQPGIYLNHAKVLFIGFGPEITVGPTAAQVFGNKTISLPPGASATPVAAMMPNTASQPQTTAQTPRQASTAPKPASQPQTTRQTPGQAPTAPAMDYVNPDLTQVYVDGQKYTIADLKMTGWTNDRIANLPKV